MSGVVSTLEKKTDDCWYEIFLASAWSILTNLQMMQSFVWIKVNN